MVGFAVAVCKVLLCQLETAFEMRASEFGAAALESSLPAFANKDGYRYWYDHSLPTVEAQTQWELKLVTPQ